MLESTSSQHPAGQLRNVGVLSKKKYIEKQMLLQLKNCNSLHQKALSKHTCCLLSWHFSPGTSLQCQCMLMFYTSNPNSLQSFSSGFFPVSSTMTSYHKLESLALTSLLPKVKCFSSHFLMKVFSHPSTPTCEEDLKKVCLFTSSMSFKSFSCSHYCDD